MGMGRWGQTRFTDWGWGDGVRLDLLTGGAIYKEEM